MYFAAGPIVWTCVERYAESRYDFTMAVVHISESEAASDFVGLLARVREGTEVIIESEQGPRSVVVMPQPKDGSISATLARLKTISDARGHELIMDKDFAEDVEERTHNRKVREVRGDY